VDAGVQQDCRSPCEARTKDGQPCRGRARPGSRYCPFHDAKTAAATAAGRKKGGQARSKPAAVLPGETPDAPLESVQDVIAVLGQTICQVRRGQIEAKVANAIGVLAGTLLRAIELDLSQELAELREELEARADGNGRAA